MTFPVRRLALLAIVGLLVGGAFGFWRASQSRTTSTDQVPGTYLDQVMPGLCTMEAQLASGDKFEASNTFWNDVHLPAHALAAVLLTSHRAEAGDYQRAKMAVESQLSTLAPGLAPAVHSFATATRKALLLADRPAPLPCS